MITSQALAVTYHLSPLESADLLTLLKKVQATQLTDTPSRREIRYDRYLSDLIATLEAP